MNRFDSIGRVASRLAFAISGVAMMYHEGLHQPTPGVLFVFGFACIVIACVPWKAQC